MKTVVLQSYRTVDVPEWISRCMLSVQQWAISRNWGYEFLDDDFFSLAPRWVRQRCAGNLYALTDICRLLWLQNKLSEGHGRVIWIDADVLVFAPDNLHISVHDQHAFAYELFLSIGADERIVAVEGISNALMVFTQHDPVLELYLSKCLDRLKKSHQNPLPRTALGPYLLAELTRDKALNALQGIGLFTLPLMRELASEVGPLIQGYVQRFPSPLVAANLCHFLRNATPAHQRADFDGVYNKAVDRLLDSAGGILR